MENSSTTNLRHTKRTIITKKAINASVNAFFHTIHTKGSNMLRKNKHQSQVNNSLKAIPFQLCKTPKRKQQKNCLAFIHFRTLKNLLFLPGIQRVIMFFDENQVWLIFLKYIGRLMIKTITQDLYLFSKSSNEYLKEPALFLTLW